MKRVKRIGFIGGCSIVLYVTIYSVLYCNRKPAGDLAYWCHTENGPDWVEDGLYYGFYPVYIVHQRVFHCQRHIWDFTTAYLPANFDP